MEQARLSEKPFLNLSREYPVAPDKVWRAWTEPEAVKRWWGPGSGEPVSLAELDVRVGGRFRIVFGGPDGQAHECIGVYREVVPGRKLVFTWTWPRTTPERESLVTIELKAIGRSTELLFTHEQLFDEKVRDDHKRGWSQSFANLDRFLQQTN
ncbi:MAG: SRPBCC domain-containing protein [Burkholderiales bacterium]